MPSTSTITALQSSIQDQMPKYRTIFEISKAHVNPIQGERLETGKGEGPEIAWMSRKEKV